jgi:hypothetical protein
LGLSLVEGPIFKYKGKLVTMVDPGPLPSLCNLQKVNNKDRVMIIRIKVA